MVFGYWQGMGLAFIVNADSKLECKSVRLGFERFRFKSISLEFDYFVSEGCMRIPLCLFGCGCGGFVAAEQEQRGAV
jgi:hypothetical protein